MNNTKFIIFSLIVVIAVSTLTIPATAHNESSNVSDDDGEIPHVTLISNHTEDSSENETIDINNSSDSALPTNQSTVESDNTTTEIDTSNSTTTSDANNSTTRSDTNDNTTGVVCEVDGSGNYVETEFGVILKNLLRVIVVVSGFFAVFGGAFYTAASAVRPSEKEEYLNRRNLSILYGLLILILVYGLILVMQQIQSDINFSCISPEF